MSDPKVYTVGWVCAIVTELVAARTMLDETHDEPEYLPANDNNSYVLGRMGRHNVVIAALPDGEYGTSSAAAVATHMVRSFPNIRIGLLVGVGGGAPSVRHDIRLGDVVVSSSQGGKGSVFQYDFGKTIQEKRFQATGYLNQPPVLLRTAVTNLKSLHEVDGAHLDSVVEQALSKEPRIRQRYQRQPAECDQLYRSHVVHPANTIDCLHHCNSNELNLVARPPRDKNTDNPAIHYGRIASANQLMMDALIRDRLASEESVLCFEMEAAGLMNQFPCLVIRGISAYADSHSTKAWQGYAAMTAAAYAKQLLAKIVPNKLEAEETIIHAIDPCQSKTLLLNSF